MRAPSRATWWRSSGIALLAAGLGLGLVVTASPVANATTSATRASADSSTTDRDYVELLQLRFGVAASSTDLEALLATDDWGPQLRYWVDLAEFGDVVLEPTRVGEQAQAELVASLLSDVSAGSTLHSGGPVQSLNKVVQFAGRLAEIDLESPIDLNPATADTALKLLNSFHGIKSIQELYSTVSKAASVAGKVVGFLDSVNRYTTWGLEAITDQPWRQLVTAYHDQRSTSSESQARAYFLTGELSAYYADIIEMMTRDLTDTPWDGIFPLHSRFETEAQLWDALESAHLALLYANDPATQSATAAMIDLVILTQVYSTAGRGLIGVQTSSGEIVLINDGVGELTGIQLTAGGSVFATVPELGPGARVAVADPVGAALSGNGTVSFRVNGMQPTSRSLSSIRVLAWAPTVSVSPGAGQHQWNFGVPELVTAANVSVGWSFGDGSSAQGASASHTYQCANDYDVTFTASSSAGVAVEHTRAIRIASPYAFNWAVAGDGYSVAPGTAANFTASGGDPDETTVTWSFGDGGTASGRTVEHQFSGSEMRWVTATIKDNDTSCSRSISRWISVGTSNDWVKLPTQITGDVTLSGAVAGYWANATVRIEEDASLTIPGDVPIRAAVSTLFNVYGELHLDGVDITSIRDERTPGPPGISAPPSFTFTAIRAQAGSVINLDRVLVENATTLVNATGATSVTIDDSDIFDVPYPIVASDSDELTIRDSEFRRNSVGIALTGSGETDLVGNTFRYGSVGVSVSQYAVAHLDGSVFDAMTAPVQLNGRGWRSTVTDSTVLSGGGGVQLIGAAWVGQSRLAGDLPYIVAGASVPAGTSVVVAQGAIVKIPGNGGWHPTNGFVVAGRATVEGTDLHPVTFTSVVDDSVGGDTDGVVAAENANNWRFVPFALSSAGRVDVAGADVRGGSYFIAAVPGQAWAGGWGTGAGSGGVVNVVGSEIKAGIYVTSAAATVRVADSVVDAGIGVQPTGGSTRVVVSGNDFVAGSVSVTGGGRVELTENESLVASVQQVRDVTITDNTLGGPETITLGTWSIGAVVLRNSAADGDGGRVSIWGAAPSGLTRLAADLPYVASGVRVEEGATVTVAPGTIFKFDGNGGYYPTLGFSVAGAVEVEGTSAAPVIFTSTKDDRFGGDTDRQVSSASGVDLRFVPFGIKGSGSVDVTGATALMGEQFVAAIPGSAWAGSWATEAGVGGTILIEGSDLATPVSSSANLASISIIDSTLRAGLGHTAAGSTTEIGVIDSTFPGSGISVQYAGRVEVDESTLAGLNIRGVLDTTITDNILTGTETIHLSDASVGATVSGNSAADGDGGRVSIWGTLPSGVTRLAADIPYVVDGVTVGSTSTVTVAPGTVLKFNGNGGYYPSVGFSVAGRAVVEGTPEHPVVITSVKDDSVGGDTDQAVSTASGVDLRFAPFTIKGAGSIEAHGVQAVMGNYFISAIPGSSWAGSWATEAGVGGSVLIQDSDLASPVSISADLASISIIDSTLRSGSGLAHNPSGSTTDIVVSNSTFVGAGISVQNGSRVHIDGSTVGAVSVRGVRDTTLTGNLLTGAETIALSDGAVGATVVGNAAADGDGGRVSISGALPSGDTELAADLPYVASGVTVPSGRTISFAPGTIVKLEGSGGSYPTVGFSVEGAAVVNGTAADPVIITSVKDDTVGGDTDQASATPAGNDLRFAPFTIKGAGSIEAHSVTSLSGSYFIAAIAGSSSGGTWRTGASSGGSVIVDSSDLQSPIDIRVSLADFRVSDSVMRSGAPISLQGLTGATNLAVEDNTFLGSSTAIRMTGSLAAGSGTVIARNDFSGASIGINSSGAVAAPANWWGSASGPGTSGAASVTSAVTARPWCLDAQCSTLSPAIATAIEVRSGSQPSVVAGSELSALVFGLTAGPGQTVMVSPVIIELDGATFAGGVPSEIVSSLSNGDVVVPSFRPTQVGTVTVTARSGSLQSTMQFNVVAGPPAVLVIASEGTASVELLGAGAPYAARLVDGWGNPIVGEEVRFEVSGPALFADQRIALAITDDDGIATSPAIGAGGVAGWVRVQASFEAMWVTFASTVVGDPGNAQHIVINELLTAPGSPGWVELVNAGPATVDLGGFRLVPSSGPLSIIDEGTQLGSGDVMIVETSAGLPEVGSLTLSIPDGSVVLDSVSWSGHPATSIGRCPDASGTWELTERATPGEVNACAAPPLTELVAPSPIVVGSAVVGSLLTADAGVWQPDSVLLSYQWVRNSSPISGATQPSYRVTVADVGATLAVRVTGTKDGFDSVAVVSGVTDAVLKPVQAAPAPVITGTPVVGGTLVASVEPWAPATITLDYQWYRGGTSIDGATGSAYTITPLDHGSTLTVVVTGGGAGYATVIRGSGPSDVVTFRLTGTDRDSPIPPGKRAGTGGTGVISRVL